MLKRIILQVGANPGSVLYTIGHTEPGAMGGKLSINWRTAWKARAIYWRTLKRVLTSRRHLNRFAALVDEAIATLSHPPVDESPAQMLAQLRQHERIYSALFNINLTVASGISTLMALASRLIAPLTPAPAPFLSALALQGVKTVDGELNQDLIKLAHRFRQDEPTVEYFKQAPPGFPNYQQDPALPAAFKAEFGQLLDKYGHRAVYEADVGWPRYAEDPAPLLNSIRQYIQIKPTTTPPDRAATRWADLPRQGLNRLLPWRIWLAAPLVGFLRRLLIRREKLNTIRARAMAACRRWDLALGQQWVGQGWLDRPEDIFWLTLDDVERPLMIEETAGVTLSSTVQARKDTYQTYQETKIPFRLHQSDIPSIQLGGGILPDTAEQVMMGLPISPGQARGTVLVLQSPDDFEQITADIILVMPSTDPAWLPLLNLATGLIVEMGGLLSHGSVIAREYGLPAVANIPYATTRLHTGDKVLVDGSTGIIQLLEAATDEQAHHAI